MARTPKKSAETAEQNQSSAGDGNRKINPWIPIAVVSFIIALVAILALINNNSSTTSTAGNQTTASGTTQSGGTSTDTSGQSVDVSWITLDTTPNEISSQTGIAAKMLQKVFGINAADMDKPLKDLGGDTAVQNAQDLVSQFGGGMSGSSSSSSGGSTGMGGTTTP